jgi:hypothetical protein
MEENPIPLVMEDGCILPDFGALEIYTVLLENKERPGASLRKERRKTIFRNLL